MGTTKGRGLADQLRDATGASTDLTTLAQTVYSAVAWHVSYDFACFATVDPATGLITWASKTRSLGVGDEQFAAAEYGPPDINNFAEFATAISPLACPRLTPADSPESAGVIEISWHPGLA
jgi:hypothetical protein